MTRSKLQLNAHVVEFLSQLDLKTDRTVAALVWEQSFPSHFQGQLTTLLRKAEASVNQWLKHSRALLTQLWWNDGWSIKCAVVHIQSLWKELGSFPTLHWCVVKKPPLWMSSSPQHVQMWDALRKCTDLFLKYLQVRFIHQRLCHMLTFPISRAATNNYKQSVDQTVLFQTSWVLFCSQKKG